MKVFFKIKEFKIVIVTEWNFPYDIKENRYIYLFNFINEDFSNVFALSVDSEGQSHLIKVSDINDLSVKKEFHDIKRKFLNIRQMKQLEFRIDRIIYDMPENDDKKSKEIYWIEASPAETGSLKA